MTQFTQTFKSFKDLGPVRDFLQRQQEERLKQADEDRAWAKQKRQSKAA